MSAFARASRRSYLSLLLPAAAIAAAGFWLGITLSGAASAGILFASWWLALPLTALAARSGVGPVATQFPASSLLACAALILGHGLLLIALVALPVLWWRDAPSLSGSLLIAIGLVLALVLPWRRWPALALPLLDRGEGLDSAGHTSRRIERAWRAASELTGRNEVFFSQGVPAQLLHGAVLMAPGLWLLSPLPWPWRALGVAIALGLAYAVYGIMLRQLRGLLDRARPASHAETDAPEIDDEPLPTRPLLRDAALRQALRQGRVERALALLDAGAEPVAPSLPDESDQRSALIIAATLNDSRPLRAMIAAGAPVNHRGHNLTPLLAAARDSYYGRAEIVLALVANGAELDVTDEGGRTALHHAALSAEPAVAAMLLDAGAALDLVDHDGHTPLALACAAGNPALVGLLLERKAALAPAGSVPALIAAAGGSQDEPEVIQKLLKARADVHVRDAEGRTALHHAVLAGHEAIVKALLDSGAAVDAKDDEGVTPMQSLGQDAMSSVVGTLLQQAGAKPDTPPQSEGEPEIRLSVASITRPATLLAANQRSALREWLASSSPGARAELVMEAIAQGAAEGMAMVLAKPLPPDVRLANRRLLIEVALDAWPASSELLRILPERGVSVAGGGWLARLLACSGGDAAERERIALAWLEAGADQFAPDANGIDPIQHAVAQGLERLTVRLLERGVSPRRRDFAGFTPLHRALDHDDERALRLVPLLLRHGADPQAMASSGETPLGLALTANRPALVDWLNWTGWRPPLRRLDDHDLAAAAQAGDLDTLRRLLALGLGVEGRDSQGCTALIHAAGGGHLALVDELLNRGAQLDAVAVSGVDALTAAIIAGHDAVVERLLAGGATVQPRSGQRGAPLLVAAACGGTRSVEHLLAAGARPSNSDASGNTALHAAAGYAFGSSDETRVRALLQSLLASGASIDAPNAEGLTPLHIACGASPATSIASTVGIDAALDVLLSRSRAANSADKKGCTPLHYAAANGQLTAVRRLLKRGADPACRDHGGWRAEDYANRYGFTDLVQELRAAPGTPLPVRPA